MTKKTLGKNPLFAKTEEEPVFTAEEVQAIIENVDEFTTMSFKVRKTYLKTLRDYAYTNRVEIKEALDKALETFLSTIDTSALLEYPEKPKKTRKKA